MDTWRGRSDFRREPVTKWQPEIVRAALAEHRAHYRCELSGARHADDTGAPAPQVIAPRADPHPRICAGAMFRTMPRARTIAAARSSKKIPWRHGRRGRGEAGHGPLSRIRAADLVQRAVLRRGPGFGGQPVRALGSTLGRGRGPGTVRVARWGATGARAVPSWRDFIAYAMCQQHVVVCGCPANTPHLPVRR